MLSVNNNSNYSPSFGMLQIAKNPETKAALEKCPQITFDYIEKVGKQLEQTDFLHGLIKKVGNNLVFRVTVPRGFKFPGALGEQIGINKGFMMEKHYDGNISLSDLRPRRTYGTKSKATYGWHEILELSKVKKNKDGIIEYKLPDEKGRWGVHDGLYEETRIRNLDPAFAERISILDKAIKDIAEGKIKQKDNVPYEPIMSEVQIATEEAANVAEKETAELKLKQSLDNVLNKYSS